MVENDRKKELKQWILSLIIVIIIVGITRAFLIRTVRVKGNSMEPNFNHNDINIVNLIEYRISDPKRNDIVICSYEKGVDEENIIKRVIGLPGDEIDIETKYPDGNLKYVVLVNGNEVDEPYLKENMQQKGDIEYPYTVPENSYFVMGDNRNVSSDSRTKDIGAIPKNEIMGKVFLRIFPFKNFGLIG